MLWTVCKVGFIKQYKSQKLLAFLFALSFFSPSFAEDLNKKKIDGVNLGISEKGTYFEIFQDFNRKNQFGLGLNYLDTEAIGIETDLYGNDSINNFGLNLNYRRFFNNQSSKSSFYFQLSGDVTSYSVQTKIDLTKETFSSGGLNFTCSACGELTIETEPNQISFIPSILIGYQKKVTDSVGLNFSLGAQYIQMPKLEWETNTTFEPPSYVRNQIDKWVDDTQELVDSFSNIIPTAKIGLYYLF
tara:strand:+ start:130 stop:861 length:732 start_codon:yes stop_codon:yes gene_type:complete